MLWVEFCYECYDFFDVGDVWVLMLCEIDNVLECFF